MWIPTPLDGRIMQAISYATMAVFFLPRVIPPLRPHAGRLARAAAVGFLVALAGIVLFHSVIG